MWTFQISNQQHEPQNFGPLYKHGITVLNRNDKPNWFLAENVGGITSANEGKAFAVILSEMKQAGYNIVAHKYKFEEYGVPQARHRVVIVGIKNDLNITFNIPAPLKKKYDIMHRMQMPEGSIRQRMVLDGLSFEDADNYFAAIKAKRHAC